jgi:hypothetical protein
MDGIQVRPDQVRADPGWWVQSLASTLIVGPASLQLLESWTVVAEMPLDELLVPLNLDLAAGAPVPADSVLYGGELSLDPWPQQPGRPEIAIRLPKLLDALDRHDFGLRIEVPTGRPPSQHLCRTLVGCRSLELRVRFLAEPVPSAVRIVMAEDDGEPTELTPTGQPVDGVGEVVVHFTDLAPGAVRGVRWSGGTAPR